MLADNAVEQGRFVHRLGEQGSGRRGPSWREKAENVITY